MPDTEMLMKPSATQLVVGDLLGVEVVAKNPTGIPINSAQLNVEWDSAALQLVSFKWRASWVRFWSSTGVGRFWEVAHDAPLPGGDTAQEWLVGVFNFRCIAPADSHLLRYSTFNPQHPNRPQPSHFGFRAAPFNEVPRLVDAGQIVIASQDAADTPPPTAKEVARRELLTAIRDLTSQIDLKLDMLDALENQNDVDTP